MLAKSRGFGERDWVRNMQRPPFPLAACIPPWPTGPVLFVVLFHRYSRFERSLLGLHVFRLCLKIHWQRGS